MAIDIRYAQNGERRELPALGNNQIPMYIHRTTQFFTAGGSTDYDWSGHDLYLDYGGYYDEGISSQHFVMPHEGFYIVTANLVFYPDPLETGDFLATIFNSTHISIPSGGWRTIATPWATGGQYYGSISVIDYWNKGDYASLKLDATNLTLDYYVDGMFSIAAVV